EFRRSWRLARKAPSRSSVKTGAFWIFIMTGMMLLYRYVQPSNHQSAGAYHLVFSRSSFVAAANRVASLSTFSERVGPFLVLAGVWVLVVGGLVPLRLHYMYRKDPRMLGQFSVNITRDSITTETSMGTLSKSSWNVYDYWSEEKGVIILIFHSGAYSIVSLAGLSEAQRDELRAILSAAIPKR
ncbi:MAG TPA: YcxB family protein, partial [Terracidiphilus sp.]|nr:YcxB family protein [Terracidiphilus sp.]